MNGKISYDKKQDIIFLYVPKKKYLKSIEYKDFIIDIDTKNNITNLEIHNASKQIGLSKFDLENVTNINMEFEKSEEKIKFRFEIKYVMRNKENSHTSQINDLISADFLNFKNVNNNLAFIY